MKSLLARIETKFASVPRGILWTTIIVGIWWAIDILSGGYSKRQCDEISQEIIDRGISALFADVPQLIRLLRGFDSEKIEIAQECYSKGLLFSE